MRKVMSSTLLFLVMFMVLALPVITSAEGTNGVPASIEVDAFIFGDFWIGYTLNLPTGQPTEGIGGGYAEIQDRAFDVYRNGLPWQTDEEVWWSDSVEAEGVVSVSWTDQDDGETHWLLVTLQDAPSTRGVFNRTNEWFSVGVPTLIESAMKFKGIHVSRSGIQRIRGGALYMIAPAQNFGIDSPAELGIVALFDLAGKSGKINSEYWMYWSSVPIEEFQMFGNPPDPVYLPAADIFDWRMDAIYSPG